MSIQPPRRTLSLGDNGSVTVAEVRRRKATYNRPKLYPKQLAAMFYPTDVDNNPARYSLIEATAQPLDTVIQTPRGPRRFGDLKAGDEVFSVDGTATAVKGVFPKGKQQVYRLTFSDGSVTRATGDHLWEVSDSRGSRHVMTTERLRSYTAGSLQHFEFPIAEPLRYAEKSVPIDPWLLGVLLGDGALRDNAIGFSTIDAEIVERIKSAVPSGYKIVKGTDPTSWRIVANQRGAGYEKPSIRYRAAGFEVCVARQYVGRRKTMPEAMILHAEKMRERYGDDVPSVNLRVALRGLGLLGHRHDEKFVPDLYKYNSRHIREEILRGIMDSDGSAMSEGVGSAVLEQTSSRLSDDVMEIVRSLGGLAKTRRQEPRRDGWKVSYRTNVRPADPSSLFWLPRKRCRMKTGRRLTRKLAKTEAIGLDDVQCIAVAHPRHLYLTDDCIATHNTKAGKTVAGMAWIFEQAWRDGKPGRNFWWVAPVYAQTMIAFRRLKRAFPSSLFHANNQELTITLANGAVIWFKSGEKPDNLYGEDVFAAVIDEASRVREEAWHAVRSTLTATRGPVRFIGNVKGRNNWFYRMARQAESGTPNMSYHKLTAYDAANAGVLDIAEINDAKAILPEAVFNELYLAIPHDDESNPFGLEHIRACIQPKFSELPSVAAGVDLARKRNWSVIVALDHVGHMTGIERFRDGWKQQEERVLAVTKHISTLVDGTGVGDVFYDRIKEKHLNVEPYVFTAKSKQALMEGLAVAFQNREIAVVSEGAAGKALISELENFTFMHTPRGGAIYTAPEGMDDDCVMALALAVERRRRMMPTAGGRTVEDLTRVSPWLGGSDGDTGDGEGDHEG